MTFKKGEPSANPNGSPFKPQAFIITQDCTLRLEEDHISLRIFDDGKLASIQLDPIQAISLRNHITAWKNTKTLRERRNESP